MDCPRCQQPDVEGSACPRCGVVFAKLRDPRPRLEASRPVPTAAPSVTRGGAWLRPLLVLVLALALGVGALALRGRRTDEPSVSSPPGPEESPIASSEAEDENAPPPPPTAGLPPEPEVVAVPASDLVVAADQRIVEDLSHRLRIKAIGDPDVRKAEDLFARYPNEEAVRTLLEGVLLSASGNAQRQRRFGEAAAFARRAAGIAPTSMRPRLLLMNLLLGAEDWPGAEAAAREALGLDGRSADALRGLGHALLRQDRNREAVEVLKRALEIRADAETAAMLARLEKGMADERGMTEQRISHFHLRYDGGDHEDVGREILRALERHYATLVSTLDHQPASTMAVILFSREAYFGANGAPAWSGGNFDNLDGRIRIPIGGLTASLTPEMDGTLIHELTHAFIADRTRGLAPREVHEGLAQYLEGKRCASLLDARGMTALADGRIQGVMGFYFSALSFVEYLMSARGQGGMNDLLKVMGQTGSVDQSFRQVYGQDQRATTQAWHDRLRQQHGS